MALGRAFQVQPLPAAPRLPPPPGQLGRNHLGIVEHKPVAARDQMRQIPDVVVRNVLPRTIHDHEPSVGAVSQRLLGDEPARQFVVEKG